MKEFGDCKPFNDAKLYKVTGIFVANGLMPRPHF